MAVKSIHRGKSFVLVIGLFLIVILAAAAHAAPQDQAQGNPSADVAINVGLSPTADEWGIFLAYSQAPADKISSYGLLRFRYVQDLGWDNTVAIEQARLNMSILSCLGTDQATVQVYGMPDSFDGWTEASPPSFVDTETAFSSATLLAGAADEGNVNGSSDGTYYHWTDTGSGSFASWLDQQRTSGSTPGEVTLAIVLSTTTELALGFRDTEFASNLSTACNDVGGSPILQISGAGQPLAITFASFRSGGTADMTMIGLGLLVAVGLLVGTGYTLAKRRRA